MSKKIRNIILATAAIAAFAVPALAESTNCTVTAPEIRLRKSASKKAKVVAVLKRLGYTYVTLDLEGYRTGSMNEALTESQK